MSSDEFNNVLANVNRLVDAYVNDTEDFDRMMNLTRRVLDDGSDAVLPLLLAKTKHASNADFVLFAEKIILDLMSSEGLLGAIDGVDKNIGDSRVITTMLTRILALYKSGNETTARGLEEVLVLIGTLSPATLEAARKTTISPQTASILDRVIREANASGKGEPQLPYDGKLGMPRRPTHRRATSVAHELGKKIIGKN